MFSKEFMQYLSGTDNKRNPDEKKKETENLTKPLLYIILKCQTSGK